LPGDRDWVRDLEEVGRDMQAAQPAACSGKGYANLLRTF
jgi:hypothetical protein